MFVIRQSVVIAKDFKTVGFILVITASTELTPWIREHAVLHCQGLSLPFRSAVILAAASSQSTFGHRPRGVSLWDRTKQRLREHARLLRGVTVDNGQPSPSGLPVSRRSMCQSEILSDHRRVDKLRTEIPHHSIPGRAAQGLAEFLRGGQGPQGLRQAADILRRHDQTSYPVNNSVH